MNDKLTLAVDGRLFDGWKSVSIRTGIEQISGVYELSITERWPGQTTEWTIPPGAHCAVRIGDDPVISGYVDTVGVSYDASSHEIKVTGRDAAGDLVDCSAPSTSFSGLTFAQIAEKLCAPFGITVHDETVLGRKLLSKDEKAGKNGTPPKAPRKSSAIPKLAVQNGESVFKTLEKVARSEGVLLVSDSEGGLVLTRAGLGGDSGTVLELGKNILRANFEHSHANLYSEITVKGQIAGPAATIYDTSHGQCSFKVVRPKPPSIKASDNRITRYRPLIIIAETQADSKRCKQRAEWETGNREAKARKLSVIVQGWRQENGSLWRINQTVKVKCPWMRVDERWLISAINYRLDDGGTTSELTLVSQDSFNLLPEIPEPSQGAGSDKTRVVDKETYEKARANKT